MHIALVRTPIVDIYIKEYVESLLYYLGTLGHTSIVSTWEEHPIADAYLYFHTAWYCPPPEMPRKVVLVNVEQLTRPDYSAFTLDLLEKYPNMLYADYSTANLNIVRAACGRNGFWLPYFYTPQLQCLSSTAKCIDLLFNGSMSDQRKALCDQYGATVLEVFGAARDAAIAQARCVFNCHYSTVYGIFESLRAYHSVYLGVPVFSPDASLPEECYLSPTNRKWLLSTYPPPL